MTITASEEKREEEVPAQAVPEALRRQGRTRASSVTPDEVPSPGVVTDGIRRAGQGAVRAVALLDKPGSLVHSQPPTFRQAWDRHAECAKHYEAALVRLPRYLWGCFHLAVVMAPLYLVLWLLESPARFIVTALLIGIIWLVR